MLGACCTSGALQEATGTAADLNAMELCGDACALPMGAEKRPRKLVRCSPFHAEGSKDNIPAPDKRATEAAFAWGDGMLWDANDQQFDAPAITGWPSPPSS